MRRMVRSGKRMRRILHTGSGSRRGLAVAGLLAAAATPVVFTAGSSAAPAPVGQGFTVTSSDLSHILRQIKIAETHIAKNNQPGWLVGPDGQPNTADDRGICEALVGTGPNQIATPLVADGLRTVDGSCNNLIKGQEKFGASGEIFPRLTTPIFKDAENVPPGFGPPGPTSYQQTKGLVFDSQPRLISNLIVDQTSTNPAAVSAAGSPVRTQGNEGVVSCVDVNEVQTLTGTPSAPFSLEFDGQRTATLPVDATAGQVRAALEALPNISANALSVSGTLAAGMTIKFQGTLKATNVAQLLVVAGTSPITGTNVATATPGAPAAPPDGAVDEVQTLSGSASSVFSIEFDGQTTASLPVDADASQVQSALEALPNIVAGNVTVAGGPLPAQLTITFTGTLGGQDVAEIKVVPGITAVTGLAPATSAEGAANAANCTPQGETLFIPNVTTDVGLSPPFNSLFTIFGQFFDHGVDQTVKGGGTVFVPLKDDDPLIAGKDHIRGDDPNTTADESADDLPPNLRFMVLTRGKNQPGPDGILGDNPATPAVDESADDVHDADNTDSPFVDQSQTYTSHAAHQVFLREYVMRAGKPVPTGKLLHSADGGMATWGQLKQEAASKLGLQLRDVDALDIPMVAADLYGNFIPGPNGFAQYVTETGLVEGNPAADGGKGVLPPANVKHFDIAFLTDIAHNADPSGGKPADDNDTAGTSLGPIQAGRYDDELLDQHFIAGDGRVNENIALTAVHQIFHSEHDRLVDDIKHTLIRTANLSALNEWLVTPLASVPTDPAAIETLVNDVAAWRGDRLFQAARFVTEMEYQHLVFEEFARKVQPLINPFAASRSPRRTSTRPSRPSSPTRCTASGTRCSPRRSPARTRTVRRTTSSCSTGSSTPPRTPRVEARAR